MEDKPKSLGIFRYLFYYDFPLLLIPHCYIRQSIAADRPAIQGIIAAKDLMFTFYVKNIKNITHLQSVSHFTSFKNNVPMTDFDFS